MSTKQQHESSSADGGHKNGPIVTSVLDSRQQLAALRGNATSDDATLGALGYKQEFKR